MSDMKLTSRELRNLIREVILEYVGQETIEKIGDFIDSKNLDIDDDTLFGGISKKGKGGLDSLTDPGAKRSKLNQLGNTLGVKNLPKTMTKLMSTDNPNQLSSTDAKAAAEALKNMFTLDPKVKGNDLRNIVGKTQSKQNIEDKKRQKEREKEKKKAEQQISSASGASPSTSSSSPG